MDGTVAAYRFPYLLAGDSLVLKQDSPFYEHFYSKLEPWKHYVPLKRDLSDVVEKVQWARDHDEEVSTTEVVVWWWWCVCQALLQLLVATVWIHTSQTS